MASNQEGRDLFQALARGTLPAPTLLLYGEESFLLEEAVRAIHKAVLPKGGDDFSQQVFDGPESGGQVIRQALENLPLFGGKRVVHVRHVAAMSAEDLEALIPYLDRPAPDTTLLLTDRTVDLRKRFFKAVKDSKKTVVVAFKPFYADELAGWVERRARTRGLRGMDLDLAQLVADLAGPGLAGLDSALDKLGLGAAGAPLDEGLVRSLLDDTRVRTIFELTRQLGEGDAAGGVSSVRRLLESGESAIGMVSMIARHFRIVWRVRAGRAEGLSGRGLAAQAGCPPMFLAEYERDAGRFAPERLNQVMGLLHDTERALKSSSVNDELVMSSLVLRVCL